MAETLLKNADVIVTMDDTRRELRQSDLRLINGVISEIGQGLQSDAEVVDAQGCVLTPGLVNTHHHLYQSLTRAVPGGQDALLFGWLQTLYPIWSRMTPDERRSIMDDLPGREEQTQPKRRGGRDGRRER